jgi:hypothetical protein
MLLAMPTEQIDLQAKHRTPLDRHNERPTNATPEQQPPLLPRFIKAEANLLRLPLFALGTKGLRKLDAIECRGVSRRGGETHEFTFQAARNAKTQYPGPLSRAAHLAFLSIATDHGFPITNPISWSWRDLCRRMGIQASGRTVSHIKTALTATAGLLIRSEYALHCKTDNQQIRTHMDALHIYERVTFVGSQLPDGRIADANYVWLSDWYLQNLNAMFTAPLDYELWRFLDRKSPIASRLYEFLLLNFYCGTPQLRINYETLAQFLPVRPERYLSLARKQIDPAFRLLATVDAVRDATWAPSRSGLAMLLIERGKNLTPPYQRPQLAMQLRQEVADERIEIRELRNEKAIGQQLVAEFYRLWTGAEQKPTAKESVLAANIIAHHGQPKALAAVRQAVKLMKVRWPDAKTFGAITKYLEESIREIEREEYRQDQKRAEAKAEANERSERQRQQDELLKFQPLWNSLPETERERAREIIRTKHPHMASFAGIVERFALREFARSRGGRLDTKAEAA